MRAIAVTLIILGSIPVILKYPWIGVLVSAWISLFNPHKFAWGFAYDAPFAMIIAIVMLLAMLIKPSQVHLQRSTFIVLLTALLIWMSVTTLFALEPEDARDKWIEVMKVFFFVFAAAALLQSRKQLEALIWVIVLTFGFFGVKGGIFTLLGGGGQRVYGPPGTSFVADNNAIAVALIMSIPLMQYFAGIVKSKWVRLGLFGAMVLSGFAVLGTQSRGALVAVSAMVLFLWLKARRKLVSGILLFIVVPLTVGFMPDSWTGRMQTIETYEVDASAQGRLNSWRTAINVANDRPLVGGGFELYTKNVFERYAPNPRDVRSAHSIYFQMLGEHGYPGLILFLALGINAWVVARRIIRVSRDRADFVWAAQLARAIQVSLIGFAVGGAFINISYWELPYYEIVILTAVYRLAAAAQPNPDQSRLKTNLAVT